MSDIFEDDKMIFKKEIFLSVLSWSVLGFALILILNLIGIFIIDPGIKLESTELESSTFGLGLLFFTLIPTLLLGIIFYIALKNNWRRFGFIKYKFKLTYLTYILIFIILFDFILNLIITGQFELPKFGLLSLIMLFLIPLLIKK